MWHKEAAYKLTLKPANFYNIEKHIKHTSILKVNYACCVHITDYGLIPYQRILALFIHIMKAYIINYKKVCYTKNPFLMKPWTSHHLIIQYNSHVMLR